MVSPNLLNTQLNVQVRNFLGEKFIRKVRMHPGVTVENSKGQKDELIVQVNVTRLIFVYIREGIKKKSIFIRK